MKRFNANTIINYHIRHDSQTTKDAWGAAWRAESCKAAAAVTPFGALLLDKGMSVN
jgi:hypothetical protein